VPFFWVRVFEARLTSIVIADQSDRAAGARKVAITSESTADRGKADPDLNLRMTAVGRSEPIAHDWHFHGRPTQLAMTSTAMEARNIAPPTYMRVKSRLPASSSTARGGT